VLAHLAALGKRVIIRLEEDYYDHDAPQRIRGQVRDAMRLVPVDAIVMGVEPDAPFSLKYGAPSWGQDSARSHANAMAKVRQALADLGPRLISPGWTAGMKHVVDDLYPGKQAWRLECGEAYAECDANGGHVYLHVWRGWQDEFYFINQVNELAQMFHKPLFIDEVGVTDGSDVEQMRAYIRMTQMLEDEHWEAGQRVVGFVPFISTGDPGNPPVWNGKYLLKEEAAYQLLGTFMGGN
jgi:hypothetical protein